MPTHHHRVTSTPAGVERLGPVCGRGRTYWIPIRLACRRSGIDAVEPAIDRKRLAVDVGGFIAEQEQPHRREFVRLPCPLQRIELADLALGAALLAPSKIGLVMPVSIRPEQDGVDAHAGARQRIGRVCTRLITPALLAA